MIWGSLFDFCEPCFLATTDRGDDSISLLTRTGLKDWHPVGVQLPSLPAALSPIPSLRFSVFFVFAFCIPLVSVRLSGIRHYLAELASNSFLGNTELQKGPGVLASSPFRRGLVTERASLSYKRKLCRPSSCLEPGAWAFWLLRGS